MHEQAEHAVKERSPAAPIRGEVASQKKHLQIRYGFKSTPPGAIALADSAPMAGGTKSGVPTDVGTRALPRTVGAFRW